MKKGVYYCTLIVALGVVIAISAAKPDVLGHGNSFLQGFVNHEFINTMGVIATITLASTAQIHLTFNSIEEKLQRRGLTESRRGVRQSAFALIFLLAFSVVVVTVKPLLGDGASAVAFCNGLALFILLWSVLILLSITRLVFAIAPLIDSDKGERR